MQTPGSNGRYLPVERRAGVRILTLKNAGWFLLALLLVFIAVSFYYEHRSSKEGEPGRLYERRLRDDEAPAKKQKPKEGKPDPVPSESGGESTTSREVLLRERSA